MTTVLQLKVQARLQLVEYNPPINGEYIYLSWEPAQFLHPAISGFRAYHIEWDGSSDTLLERGSASIAGSNLTVLWDGHSAPTDYLIDIIQFVNNV